MGRRRSSRRSYYSSSSYRRRAIRVVSPTAFSRRRSYRDILNSYSFNYPYLGRRTPPLGATLKKMSAVGGDRHPYLTRPKPPTKFKLRGSPVRFAQGRVYFGHEHCRRRRVRREMVFAMNKQGRGSGSRLKRITQESKKAC